jgi:hypothetical protein
MYACLNDLTLLVGFTPEQREQLRRALGEERQALFDRPLLFTAREVAWLSRVVWPDLTRVIEADVGLAITERGMTAEAATAWGMETHSAMVALIRRLGRVIERNMATLPGFGEIEPADPVVPSTQDEPDLTTVTLSGNVTPIRSRHRPFG